MGKPSYSITESQVDCAPTIYGGARVPGHSGLIRRCCPCCEQRFLPGDYVVYVPLGPGDDPIQRKKAHNGDPFVSFVMVLHLPCANGRTIVAEELAPGMKVARPAGGPELTKQRQQPAGGDPGVVTRHE
jgi:hypothetical protein